MGKISKLPLDVVTQIAAGEVIERPASVLKELVENAIDAQAQTITIQIQQGGLERIVVADDGEGMDEADLQNCFLPHTTSKLFTIDDLHDVLTLGFRGEALSSIAAVSRLTIASRQASEPVGNQIIVHQGTIIDTIPSGMSVGTRVVVERLFDTVPARKKFLKTAQTEWRYCLNLLTQVALAHPHINFTLLHNGENILHLFSQPAADRIESLLGDQLRQHLLPIAYESSYGKVAGYIGTPQSAQQSNHRQFITINNRPVSHAGLARTIKQAYGTLLDVKSFPVFSLSLQLPSGLVDANIHPRKETIRLLHSEQIFTELAAQVHQVLQTHNLTYQQSEHAWQLQEDGMDRYSVKFIRDATSAWDVRQIDVENDTDILQIHRCYLVMQTKQGLLLLDQHAAHERILYEQFKKTYEDSVDSAQSVTLAAPLVFDLPIHEAALLAEHLYDLERIGFEIELFGEASFKVSAVPRMYAERNIAMLVSELVHDMAEGPAGTVDSVTNRTLSFLACRTAIKAGDILTLDQRRALVEKLHETKTQYTCPHGRPVQVHISQSELEKLFKRH